MLLEKDVLHNVYLGLGSNLGDRRKNISDAITNIEKRIGKVVALSAFYVTEPEGFDSENQFLNAACKVETSMWPMLLLRETQRIERRMGRKTKSVDGIHTDRIIDIDILLFDNLIIKEKELILPHPHLHERSFVLIPLFEIAKDYVHPLLGKTISELKEELD